MPDPRSLPIYDIETDLVAAVRGNGRVVVQAPTGSGKSTQIPQMLFRHGLADEGQVVILQPRRLATRMLARRVAEEWGTPLGAGVGYQIRLDSCASRQTRMLYVTEGILLRRMTEDPDLKGVAAIIFDEFHERHLYGDICLARGLQIQHTRRPGLKLLVMSATLDTAAVASYLAPCATITSEGRTFPVAIEYLRHPFDPERDPVWDVAAREAARLAETLPEGDLLVFMPGAYEIARTLQALDLQRGLRGWTLLPLHGELPAAEQDRAVARCDTRKVIVSTNVAETSLTIEGITGVVDGGLARMARYDPHRGINTLLVEKISAASADQRAGRAGRTAPGRCIRLWTEREHAKRPPQEVPEVRRLDLSEVVLALKASGINDLAAFPWLEKPDPRSLERAELLLADLGAVHSPAPGAAAEITPTGRRMLRFPVHPRYARMFLAAETRGCVRPVALMAALTQGRSFWLRNQPKAVDEAREEVLGEEDSSDFFRLMRAWRFAERERFSVDACRRLGIHAQSARQVRPLFEQFLDIAGKEGLDIAERRVDDASVRKCVLAGFPDHLARRLDSGTLRCAVVHGRRGTLDRDSAIRHAPLLVAAEITEIGAGGTVSVNLGLATAIEEAWLEELFPEDFAAAEEAVYDPEAKRVVLRRERRFRDLVLESRVAPGDPPAGTAARLLAAEVLAGRLSIKAWDENVEAWITRMNRFAEWFPEMEVSPIRDEDRPLLIEQICHGLFGARELREADPMPVLRGWLPPHILGCLDELLPERVEMANGRKARLSYPKEGPPVLSARIQELYGVDRGFAVGRGRVPVRIEVLAPNQRPIQVTDDLGAFWRDMYPKVKAELQRRYPRHEWR